MEFKEYELRDICKFQEGYVNPKQTKAEYFDGEVKWLRANDLQNSYVYNTSKTLTKEGFKSAGKSAKLFKPNTIAISKSGTIGRLGILKDYMCGNRAVINIESNEKLVDIKYIYYFLLQNRAYIESLAQGSVQKNLYIFILEKVKIRLPDKEKQRKILNILNNIDNKIELNNQINNNLFEIGNELLKNDFILENEKEILSQVIKFVKGKKPNNISSNKQVGYEKYLTIACLNGQELNYADTNKMIMSNNDLLMVMDGASSGEVYCGGHGIVGSTLARIDCTDNNYISEFIFFCLKYYKDLIQSKNTGSAIPHTDKVFVGSLEIPKINIEKQEKYNVLLSKIQHNQNENKTLENLRNALLPKLMNGEIDLDKIEI